MSWSIIERWGTNLKLAKVFADRILTELKKFPEDTRKDAIILFSAHSLPLKVGYRATSIFMTLFL